jgi:RNase P subunit RPR2
MRPAKWLLRRTCDKCDYFQVLEICDTCKEYIERRNEQAKLMPLEQRPKWNCMGCGKSRRMPVGMDILGRT